MNIDRRKERKRQQVNIKDVIIYAYVYIYAQKEKQKKTRLPSHSYIILTNIAVIPLELTARNFMPNEFNALLAL